MQLSRNQARNKAMAILYQIFLYKNNNITFNNETIARETMEIRNEFVEELVKGVLDNQEEIDQYANKYLGTWPIKRLGYTDQAIIRIAIFELLFTETPDIVCINEAIELSKKYSDEKVCKMINGVLDNILHSREVNGEN